MATEAPIQFMGVDYGSKFAGTTAAAIVVGQHVQVWQSARGQDADEFLLQLIEAHTPTTVFIDAPLSLPLVFSQTPYSPDADFFFRACDREVQAMSPMFIGGLTARAIRLRSILAGKGVALLETYPSQLVHLLFPDVKGYKKDFTLLPQLAQQLQRLVPFTFATEPQDWHQFDALLAWYSGYRHLNGQAILYGNAREGRIIV